MYKGFMNFLKVLLCYTAVDVLGLFFPLLCAKEDAPTGSRVVLGCAFRALYVATIAPWKLKNKSLIKTMETKKNKFSHIQSLNVTKQQIFNCKICVS